jgi:hypothetical protein
LITGTLRIVNFELKRIAPTLILQGLNMKMADLAIVVSLSPDFNKHRFY